MFKLKHSIYSYDIKVSAAIFCRWWRKDIVDDRSLSRFGFSDCPAENTAAAAADDMRHLRDIVIGKYAVYYLSAKIEHGNENKGQGYFSAFAVCKWMVYPPDAGA